MAELGRKQREQTRRELERDARRRARAALTSLREQIRAAKKTRKQRLHAVSCSCKAARRRNAARAKRARERLNASIRRTRDRAQSICDVARGEAKADTLRAIDQAIDALTSERAHQRQLAAWTRDRKPAKATTRRERVQESDDQVEANIDDPGLLIVWRSVRAKIKAGPRRSRTEAFFEWAAEHPAQVYEIQEADAVRQLEQLERKERELARAVRRRSAAALSAVPF